MEPDDQQEKRHLRRVLTLRSARFMVNCMITEGGSLVRHASAISAVLLGADCDENGERMDDQDENGERMDDQDENGERMDDQDENGERMDDQDENGERMDDQDENGERMDGRDEAGNRAKASKLCRRCGRGIPPRMRCSV